MNVCTIQQLKVEDSAIFFLSTFLYGIYKFGLQINWGCFILNLKNNMAKTKLTNVRIYIDRSHRNKLQPPSYSEFIVITF